MNKILHDKLKRDTNAKHKIFKRVENMNEKTKYFIDYWRDLTHESNSIENEFVHSIIYNPKELIKEFIDEIERKNLSNKDNKKFFIDSLGKFANLDINSLSFIKPILKLILKEQNSDHSYLLHLLKTALTKLDDFTLGKESVIELAEILTNDSDINTAKLKNLVNLIIFELIHKKYSKKTIVKIIDYIFSNYQFLSENSIHTNFPHKIEYENWDSNSSEYSEYQSALKTYIDNLTDKDRILALCNYFDKEAEELKFVFQIKGLKGDDVNITIGDVQIYNPKSLRLFDNDKANDELFDNDMKDNIFYCNGAVTLNIFDTEYAKQEALQILENTLDLIASRYIDYKVPIIVNKYKYYIIDMSGKNRGEGSESTWEYLRYRYSMEFEASKYDNPKYTKQISKDKVLEVDKKILESMHWKRKAVEANESNEKILWHWVALENLFETKNSSDKTPNVIFKVVSKLLTKKYMYSFAWKHFQKLENITSDNPLKKALSKEKQLLLTDELRTNIGLNANEGESIHLENFIHNIDKIIPFLEQNSLFYEQLKYLQKIFTDKKQCLELMDKFEKIFFEKLVYVYRIRNKIVHNAHNDSSPLVDYYVDFITLVSAISTNEFIKIRAEILLETNVEIINNMIYEYDEFKLKLNEKGTNILLKNTDS